MSEADELFDRAYHLYVVEEKYHEAINLCRQATEIDPNNYRVRVLLGMLLSDYGNDEEKMESRQQFIEAINGVRGGLLLCDSGYEESAIHHLGVWEWGQEHHHNACLFFLMDSMVCGSKASYNYLLELLEELNPNISAEVKLLLTRLNVEYKCIPKSNATVA